MATPSVLLGWAPPNARGLPERACEREGRAAKQARSVARRAEACQQPLPARVNKHARSRQVLCICTTLGNDSTFLVSDIGTMVNCRCRWHRKPDLHHEGWVYASLA